MKDSVSIQRLKNIHPKLRDEIETLIDKIEFNNIFSIRIVQGFRSFTEQHELFCQPSDGKDNDGDGKIDEKDEMVTKADAGKSYHNYGLAIDFAILYNDGKVLSWNLAKDGNSNGVADWMEVVNVFKANGWVWGGDWKGGFKDNPHLEKTFGLSVSQCLQRYLAKNFIPNSIYINI